MMKKCLTLALLIMGHIVLYAQTRKLTINLNRQPISALFKHINEQCGYNFVYSDEVISDTIIVSLAVTRTPVMQVFEMVLPEKQLFHQVLSDKLIVIGSKKHLKKEGTSLLKTTIGGIITDEKGKAISFASLALFEAGKFLAGSISTEAGKYLLSYNFQSQHQYQLKVSSLGYKASEINFVYPDTASIGRIILPIEQNTLKAVVVTGNKPLIERKTDRYVVNVEGSILSTGNNGLEVLQKSPGIWVGSDGSIRIRGNQSVMVMINDVVQRMSQNDLAEYLRTLRSEDILKIEIISNPASEYEAEGSGGIIHIVLKKTRKDGLIGTIASQYRQQEKRPDYSASTSLNYKVKSLYLFGSVAAGKDESDYIATNQISYPNQDYYSSKTDRYNNNGRLMYRFGGAYDLGKNQSIGIQTVQTINKLNQFFETSIDFSGAEPLTGRANSEWFRRPAMNSTTLNYSIKTDSLGSGIKVMADYIYSTKTELNNFASVYTLDHKNTTYRNNTPNFTNLYSIQTDFTKIFGKALSFKTGVKFVGTKRDNEVLNENLIGGNWIKNTNLSNRFIYKEQLSMAYASLEKSWGNLSAKAGLRAEYTYMNGNSITANEQFNRDYLSLFPSVFISQKLDKEKGSSVFFSTSRRLRRPSFADLNPYRLQFDNYLTQLGNPNLMPEYTYKAEAGTIFWKGWQAEVYYALTDDKIAQLANPVAGNIIEYQNRNFSSSNEYGISLYAPITIRKWWTTNNSFAAYSLRYTLDDYQIKQNTFFAQTQHAITIKKLLNIDLSADYRSPHVRANTQVAYQFGAYFGVSKRLYNNQMMLRFTVGDVFNTVREKDYTEFAGTRIDFYQKRPTRNFNLGFSYSFNSGKKFNNKRIEQSNDEEKGRL